MFKLKKVGALGLAAIATVSFVSAAKAATYYRFTHYTSQGQELIDNSHEPAIKPSALYYQDNIGIVDLSKWFNNTDGTKNFVLTIQGNDFDESETYSIKVNALTKGTYTGEQLNAGVELNFASMTIPTSGVQLFTIEDSNNLVQTLYTFTCDGLTQECNNETKADPEFQTIRFNFGTQSTPSNPGGPSGPTEPTEEEKAALLAFANSIPKNGKIKLNAIQPENEQEAQFIISALLAQEYSNEDYMVYGYISEGQGYLCVQSYANGNNNKDLEVEYVWETNVNTGAMQVIDDLVEKIASLGENWVNDYSKRFVIDDLDSINYFYNAGKAANYDLALGSMTNYSSQLHALVGNANIDFIYQVGMGGDESDFYEEFGGEVNVLYDGVVYKEVGPIGVNLNQIIYIPSDTTKDRDSFIAAAKKRINDYLKGVDVTIEYGGLISSLEQVQYKFFYSDMQGPHYTDVFDLDDTNGEWYIITIGEDEYPYFIVADSDMMKTPTLKTVDINTNIGVSAGSFDVPLDSRVNVEKLDPKSDEYKKLAKNFKILDEMSYDIELFSTSLDVKIEKLSDGKFKVYVPIASKYKNSKLKAAYLKADGTKEYHEITIEGDYAVFETDHFSTYSIVTDGNPKTGDEIVLFVLAFTAAGYTLYKVKRFN